MTTISEQQHMDSLHLDTSWQWLCQARKSAPANADIWDLRYRWPAYRESFLAQLQSGEYRLSPMRVVGRERQVMWSAEDALALKWVALQLVGEIPLHEKCEHLKGHGGGLASVQRVQAAINTKAYRWVCRTDIKGYYGAINTDTLLLQLTAHITRPALLSLLRQFLHYSVEEGGNFHTPSQGIAHSCALSPLMGALHLWLVDNYFATQEKIYYARYMDDFLILTPTRWSLRRQVKQLNRYLNQFGFEKRPEKTFIGRIAKSFDWMGAWLTDAGVTDIAPRAKANHQEKLRRLYEQIQHWPKDRQKQRVSEYKKRGESWHTLKAMRELTLVGILSFFSLMPAASIASSNPTGTYDVGSGVAWVGDTISRSENLDGMTCNAWQYAGNLLTGTVSSGEWGVSGGYEGIKLAEDVVIFFSGYMTQDNGYTSHWLRTIPAHGGTESVFTSTFGISGQYSSNVADERVTLVPDTILNLLPKYYYDFRNTTMGSYTVFSLTPKLYVGPNASPGVYSVTRSIGVVPACNYGKYPIVSTGTITIKSLPPRICYILINPSIVNAASVLQTMQLPQVQSGKITMSGSCTGGDASNQGNLQFSIQTSNPISTAVGGPNTGVALLNSSNKKVGSVYFQNSLWSSNYLSVVGDEYSVPVQWSNINLGVDYNIVGLGPMDTQELGQGKGTARIIVAWP